MLAKKLLAIDKIQAFVKQICLLGVICKVFDRKILSNEKFCFLWDLCYQYLNFLLRAIVNKDLQIFSKMCAPDQWTEIKGKRVIRRSQSSTSQTFSDLFTHIQLSSGKFTFLASNVRFYIFFFRPSCWLAHNQLSWNLLLFSCIPIGQLCLGEPDYNSRTVTFFWFLFLICSAKAMPKK